jgi:hypothetical protein
VPNANGAEINDDFVPTYSGEYEYVEGYEGNISYDQFDSEYERNSDMSEKDWYLTPSGNKCPWCKDGLTSPFEPEDEEDAEMSLCRGHAAEYAGLSLDGMDRRDQEEMYDYL